jgi:very-short-patch-repair endonuclease
MTERRGAPLTALALAVLLADGGIDGAGAFVCVSVRCCCVSVWIGDGRASEHRGVGSEWNIDRDIRGGCTSRSADALIADLAARQHGVVARGQLVALGVGPDAIDRRIAARRLQAIHRGVFAVGHRLRTREATWMAAILAAGPDAVLGVRSAGALWRVRQSDRLEVICPRRLRRPGLEVHRGALRSDEVTVEDGIPVTTPARTLFDLAAVVSFHQLEAAFNEAEYRRLTSPVSLDALLARYPGRRGTQAIRRVLDDHARNGETRSRSELERALIRLVDAAGLPRPLINRQSDHGELDARWPEHMLIVECDGFAAHGTRKAFEDDRARDRALTTQGWRVVRITWRQLTEQPDAIARQLATLLEHRG